jgi:hypothetical protein
LSNSAGLALANGALALPYYGQDIGAMMTMVDRALALNPSFARVGTLEPPAQAALTGGFLLSRRTR